MGFKSIFALVFYLGLSFSPSALFALTRSVAVMPFENTMKDSSLDWLSMGIPETITNDLLAVKEIALVERIQLRKIFEEQRLQLTGAIDEKTVVQVGKLIGASVLVVGAFQKQDNIIRLTARFVDVETGGVLQTAKATGPMNEIFDLQDHIVKEFIKNFDIELKQQELAQIEVQPTESLEAYQHFGQGALLQAKKDYQGAVKELESAIQVDPQFTAAKEKFKEAFWSLNKNNYWAYSAQGGVATGGVFGGKPTDVESTQMRRAGGVEDFSGGPAFTYIYDQESTQQDRGQSDLIYHQITKSEFYSKKEDGIYLLGFKTNVKDKQNNLTTNFETYEPPYLIFPYDLEVGKEWVSRYKSKAIYKTDYNVDGDSHQSENEYIFYIEETRKVIRKETVTVPAGVFECFVIESRSREGKKPNKYNKGGSNAIYWFASGIGIVKVQSGAYASSFLVNINIQSETVLKEYYVQQ